MLRDKRTREFTSFTLMRIAIEMMEKEAGKSILEIPPDELVRRIRGLSTIDFKLIGLKCKRSSLRSVKRRFLRLIEEKKFPDYVVKMRNLKGRIKPARIPIMDSVKRNMYDIRASILAQSKHGLKKTHIMYKSNLSHSLLLKYLDDLLRLGLLEYDEDNRTYKTTELGHEFLHAYEQLRKLLKGEDAEQVVLDENSRNTAIFKLHRIKRRTVYDNYALILQKASRIASKYAFRKSIERSRDVIDGYIELLTRLNFIEKREKNEFKTTPRGLQYLDTYLYFLLFNYLE